MPGMNMFPGGTTLQIPLDAPAGFTAKAGNAQVTLTWTDPKDKYATPEGETAQDPDQLVSVWDHTVLVRKTGSQPAGPNDGTVVVSSSVRNQYQSTGYTDTGLTNDVTYYYGVFAYNKDGVASEGAFASAMPQAGTPIGELTEGTLITITENGTPVEFYVADHDYQSDLNGNGRTLMVRKDCQSSQQWNNTKVNDWENSSILSWLNTSYLNTLSNYVKNLIGTTLYPYTYNHGDGDIATSTTSNSIFLMSSNELGLPHMGFNTEEGTTIPISNSLKVAFLNGSPSPQWTRSVHRSFTTSAVYATKDGTVAGGSVLADYGARPCFTLPSTALLDTNNALIES